MVSLTQCMYQFYYILLLILREDWFYNEKKATKIQVKKFCNIFQHVLEFDMYTRQTNFQIIIRWSISNLIHIFLDQKLNMQHQYIDSFKRLIITDGIVGNVFKFFYNLVKFALEYSIYIQFKKKRQNDLWIGTKVGSVFINTYCRIVGWNFPCYYYLGITFMLKTDASFDI